MPENRKYFVNKTVLFITARTEEGLPLIPSYPLNLIIWGILGRARQKFSIRVCYFIFMANHLHMIVVVENPEHVSAFIGYVKCEIAHAVNRLLNRRRKTVWAEGYDSPVVLTYESVIRYIEYIFTNPLRANLVNYLHEYPGVSSWKMFTSGNFERKCYHVARDEILPLPEAAISITKQKQLEKYYTEIASPVMFELEPFAWLDCFPGASETDVETIKSRIVSQVNERALEYITLRKSEKKSVLGPTALRYQSMLKEYTPKKFSTKMICISCCKDLRRSFISHYRALCDRARKVFEAWKIGDLTEGIPPGLLAPRVPVLVSVCHRLL